VTSEGPARGARLDRLTERWHARHRAREATRAAAGAPRAPADDERAARARARLPWRDVSPADYLARHGADIVAYTYDAYLYEDPELQAWIDELGQLIRARDAADADGGS
jgi:hypothetical protein